MAHSGAETGSLIPVTNYVLLSASVGWRISFSWEVTITGHWGSHSGVDEDSRLLGCYAVSTGKYLVTK
jgi:hypothetical protein